MAIKIIFTNKQKKEIVRFYEDELMSLREIGKMFGLGSKPILRLLKEQDIITNMSLRKKKLFEKGKLEIWNKNKKGVQSSSIKGRTYEEYYGEERTKEIKQKQHIFRQNRTFEEIMGTEKAKKTKEKIGLANKDKKFTKEHKKNLGLAHKGKLSGKNHPRYGIKGKDNPLYGKHVSPETEFKKGNIPWIEGKTSKEDPRILSKEKHYNWQGGLSFEPYGIEFNKELKEQVRERDNHTCQECGKIQKELRRILAVHHIDYNKQNNSPFNLISLCLKCHLKTNQNREHWENYFKMKMFIKILFDPRNILIFNENKQLIGINRI